MNCPLCGEVCRCHLEPPPSALPQRRTDAESYSAPTPLCVSDADAATEAASAATAPEDASPDASAWRDELSARLNRYRARRKVRPPRYPSLRLQFDAVESSSGANGLASPTAYGPVSDRALALDGMRQEPSAAPNTEVDPEPAAAREPVRQSVPPAAGHSGAKIIEFPGFAWGPPSSSPDQLAEPVSDRPRILEVPEVEPAAPALGGITMEATEREEVEKRPGIDIPLQSAPLVRRLMAAFVDGLIIAAASALFGFIFWKVVAARPPLAQILGLGVGVPALLWAAYQYLLIVYGGSTPGLRAAGLELARFDGTHTRRRLRRWRVLASFLSALSLGMGYAWVFLDEDALCWHDRITHTYLAPRSREVAAAKQTSEA